MLTAELLLTELKGRVTCAVVGVDINPFRSRPSKEFVRIDMNFYGPTAIGVHTITELLGSLEKYFAV